MRRLLLALALAATACGGDTNDGDPAIAAEAAGQRLTTEELGQFLAKAKPEALNAGLAGFVARVWVDYTLLSQAVAKGISLTDSAALAAALVTPARQETVRLWHDTLVARRPALDPSQADTVYAQDSVRVLQHILLLLRENMPAQELANVRTTADSLLTAARAGADFAALARAASKDTNTAQNGGYLPPRPRGTWVQPMDQVGWGLKPGEVSGLVVTPFGVHILRRPPVDEVRTPLLQWRQARLTARLDSLHVDSLLTANATEVAAFAADTIRAIAAWRTPPSGSATPLVTAKAGSLTRGDVEHVLAALPPETLEQMTQFPDSQAKLLARDFAATMLLQKQAEAAGLRLNDAQRQQLASFYVGELEQVRELAGLKDPALTDPSRPVTEREKVAARKTMEVVGMFVGGQRRYRPMQPGLAATLRLRYPYSLSPAGIRGAVEVARKAQVKAAQDSAAK